MPVSPAEPTAELLARAQAGDADAYLALHRRFHRPMLAVAARFTGDASAADEVVQEAWEAILRGLEAFEGRSRLSTWIFAIVANKARSRHRKEHRTLPFSAFEEPDEQHGSRFDAAGHWVASPAPWTRRPDDIVADRQLAAKVWELLDHLPEQQRAVVLLRDVHGQDAKDVCNLLGLTETNQRVLLHRGRLRLRALLEAFQGKAP